MAQLKAKWYALGMLALVLALDALGIFLFTSGFFLTRLELDAQSSCGAIPTLAGEDLRQTQRHQCWTSNDPRFNRVILVVIDALKYEFAQWREDLGLAQERPFDNKLPVVHSLLRRKPLQSLLVPFYADPPTTTLQRLKGLTTGGFPTFLEVKDDFDSHGMEITEDNILDLLLGANKSLVFMGDDTWMALYPQQFKRAFPFPSFNVKDLHTVDNGVNKHLAEEMGKDDWDVIIAHFLGVDHVGHRYGPFHPAMKDKLLQMNAVIEDLVNLMEEQDMQDTLLFVFGDHGMTDDGNHGGASKEEVGAALFMYTPGELMRPQGADKDDATSQREAVLRMVNDLHGRGAQRHSDGKDAHPVIQQIDLAPTLALLLGLPIPFSSLGMIIPELFLCNGGHSKNSTYLERVKVLNEALLVNVAQVFRYLMNLNVAFKRTYDDQSSTSIDASTLDALKRKVETAYEELEQLEEKGADNEKLLRAHIRAYHIGRECLRLASEEGRRIWTTFNVPFMVSGILVCVLSAVIRVTYLLNAFDISINRIGKAALFLFLMELCGLFSNSYIEAEHLVTMFATVTLSVFVLFDSFSKDASRSVCLASLAIACIARVCARLGPQQWYRGQELIPGDIYHPWAWGFTFLPSVALGYIGWIVLGRGSSASLFLAQIVLMIGYWLAQSLVKIDQSSLAAWHMYSARAVFLLSLIGVVQCYMSSKESKFKLVLSMLPSFMLLTGPSSALVCMLVLVQCCCLNVLLTANKLDSTTKCLLWLNLLLQTFYATGHECKIAKLHIGSAYVGFDEFDKTRSGFFLALNSLAAYIVFTLGLPFLAHPKGSTTKEAIHLCLLVSLRAIATTLFVTLERRHLMVWAIFAPKFACDAIILLVVDALCLITCSIN